MIQFYNSQLLGTSLYAEPTEDLKVFERRLKEIIDGLRPKAKLWRVKFLASLGNHPCFVLSVFLMIVLFSCGVHKKVVLPNIIAQRTRSVLVEYNITCDNSGKLIILPRPN
ncbi:hypothetical protein ACTXT7_009042 [Hymenolepis weldensis]